MVPGKLADQIAVQRLREPRVGHGRGQAHRGKLLRGLQAFVQPRPKRKDGNGGAFADDPPLADVKRHAFHRHLDAIAFAARITDRAGQVADACRRRNHVLQLGLVRRGHDHEIGQAAEISEVERARMRRAIGAHEASPVEHETHRQVLHGNVVHKLIVAALQER